METKLHPTPVTSQSITGNRCVDVGKKILRCRSREGKQSKQNPEKHMAVLCKPS